MTATGYIKKIIDERHAILAGEIRDEQGERVTESQGEFVLFKEDQFRQMGIVPDAYIDRVVKALFNTSDGTN